MRNSKVIIKILLYTSLVLLAVSISYEIILSGRVVSQSENSISGRIEILLASTDMIGQWWINSSDKNDELINKIWQGETPDEWRKNGVSFYLLENNEIIFWANHNFINTADDSLIRQGSDRVEVVDQNKVLIFTKVRGPRRAVTIVKLCQKEISNLAVFDNPSVLVLQTPPESLPGYKIQKLAPHGKMAYLLTKQEGNYSMAMVIVEWLAFFLLLGALTLYLGTRAKSSNIIYQAVAFAVALIVLRVVVNYSDFPQGATLTWSSIGSMMVTFAMLLLYVCYLYAVRFQFARQFARQKPYKRWVVYIIFAFFLYGNMVFFHNAMLTIIDHSQIMSEIFDVFSLSLDGIKFYLLCSILACYVVICTMIFRWLFAHQNIVWRAVINGAIAITLIYLYSTSLSVVDFILLGSIMAICGLGLMSKKVTTSQVFLAVIVVLSIYVSLVASIRSSQIKEYDAIRYARLLSHNNLPAKVQYPDMTCSVISPLGVTIVQGPALDLGELLALASKTTRGTMYGSEYIHMIEPIKGNRLAVVSYPIATWFDVCSLICYLFLWLYIVSGTTLYLLGGDPFAMRSNKSLVYRIEVIVVGVVLFSMLIVAGVVYKYSESNYQIQTRELLGSISTRLMESFERYARDNVVYDSPEELTQMADSVIIDWYTDRGNAFNARVTLYNLKGQKIGGNDAPNSPSKLDHTAFSKLTHHSLPYYDQYQNNISSIYMAFLVGQTKVGYFELKARKANSSYKQYWLLSNILDVFAILIIVSLLLSIVLYSLVATPLRILTDSLGDIGKLHKIPISSQAKMNDEVGRLILQYNRMIDYLEDSYIALARSEREGAWREMARGVAHEIKNPLTPMKLKIQMLLRARQEHSPQAEKQLDSTLKVLIEQIDVLSQIASDFSDLAHLDQGTLTKLALNGIVNNIVTLYDNNTKDLHIVFHDQSSGTLFVMASYVPLSRLLINVLQNATQALLSSGFESNFIEVILRNNGQQAMIDIADDGPGIAPELLDRIFELNFTTRTNGSGLGLSMCRQITESFSGSISVRNKETHGAVFTITLPLVADDRLSCVVLNKS
ncbi:MAG: HAMP domain-containing sensor histidine kinase [Mucinivorans sp.]